jgi:hypothetical protein
LRLHLAMKLHREPTVAGNRFWGNAQQTSG